MVCPAVDCPECYTYTTRIVQEGKLTCVCDACEEDDSKECQQSSW